MKRIVLFTVCILGMFAIAGCHKPMPMPTGAINATDAAINENLQALHAGVLQYKADVAAGKHTPTNNEKVLLNKIILTLNEADGIYQSYHNALKADPTLGEPAELSALIAALTANITSLETFIEGVK